MLSPAAIVIAGESILIAWRTAEQTRYAGRFPAELLSDGTRNTTRYGVTRHTTHAAIPLAETTLCGREIRNDLRIVL